MGCCDNDNEGASKNKDITGAKIDRSCTDIVCCLLFIIAILGLGTVGVWAFVMGDYRRIIYPTDSNGQLCGIDKDVKERPYLYFFNIVKCVLNPAQSVSFGCATPQVCVSKCPDAYWPDTKSFTYPNRSLMVCKDGKNGYADDYKDTPIEKLISNFDCAPFVLKSRSVLNRCLPSAFEDVFNFVDEQNIKITSSNLTTGAEAFLKLAQIGQNIVNDIIRSQFYIIAGLGLTMVLALLWTVLLRFIAAIIVYITLVLFVLLFGGLTAAGFIRYYYLLEESKDQEDFRFTLSLNYYYYRQEVWLGVGITCGIILLIILLVLLFLRNRIRIAIALIREASKAVSYMMSTLFFPIITFLLEICVVALAIALAVYLQTVGTKEGSYANYAEFNQSSFGDVKNNLQSQFAAIPCDPGNRTTLEGKICHFVKYGGSTYVIILHAFNLFMFFWLFNFVIGIGQMTLAGAFSSYYFAFSKPRDIPTFPLLYGFWRALRYHLGTIAFGSLILAIVQFIRAVLEYINQKCKGSGNPLAQFLLKCLICCLWCLEKCLKFLNKNAFIITAIYGQNFCMAAKTAFSLIMRNILRVFVVDKLTDFVLFVGKLVVVAAVVSLSYFFYDGTLGRQHNLIMDQTPELNYIFVPIIITVIGAFIITSLFFGVYNMAVDTLFLCFLEDLERNDGSPEKPYFMSKDVMKILGKKNTKPAS